MRKFLSSLRIRSGNEYKNASRIIFLLLILYFLSLSVVSTHTELEHTNPVHYTNKLAVVNSKVTYHTPINITGNSELANISTFGDGGVTNPYIIENLVINNCTAASGTGISIRNTDKYFVLRNITVSNCSVGISFSYVKFGSVINSNINSNGDEGYGISLDSSSNNTLTSNIVTSYVGPGIATLGIVLFHSYNNILTNNIAMEYYSGFFLNNSTYNNLINNTATKNYGGFTLIFNASYNSLINNTADNNYGGGGGGGFDTSIYSNNNILIGNTASNNYAYGFTISSSNNILKNNTGNYNRLGDLFMIVNNIINNNTLVDNQFIIINNELADSFSTTLFSYNNLISIIILLGVSTAISYSYFNTKKEKITLLEKPSSSSWYFGLVASVLVILSIFFPYLTITYYGTPSNADILQLSMFSVVLLLGGGVLTIISVLIYKRAKFFDECKIAEHISLIGLITQIIGFLLMLFAYNDIVNNINSIKNIAPTFYIGGPYHYIINPSNGLFLGLFGILLVLIAYYYQRKENKEYLQDELENNETAKSKTI